MSGVRYESVAGLTYPGSDVASVRDLSLEVAEGEFLVLVGPPGSGTSTVGRMLAGLEDVSNGRISIGGRDVTDASASERDIALVFQNYALYPHMTVADNIGFALRMRGLPKSEIAERVRDAAAVLGLEEWLDRKPAALSGAQRQRVLIGRALVRRPHVLLVDDTDLSNLEARLWSVARSEFAAVQKRLRLTTLYVTNDQATALVLGDRIAVMVNGELQQVGTALEVFERPANLSVARFIGTPPMNIFRVPLVEGRARLGALVVDLSQGTSLSTPDWPVETVALGVRPEGLVVAESGVGLPVRVSRIEHKAGDTFVHGLLDGTDVLSEGAVTVSWGTDHQPRVGDRLALRPLPGMVHPFSLESGERLDVVPHVFPADRDPGQEPLLGQVLSRTPGEVHVISRDPATGDELRIVVAADSTSSGFGVGDLVTVEFTQEEDGATSAHLVPPPTTGATEWSIVEASSWAERILDQLDES